jgi:hypothetical protein
MFIEVDGTGRMRDDLQDANDPHALCLADELLPLTFTVKNYVYVLEKKIDFHYWESGIGGTHRILLIQVDPKMPWHAALSASPETNN